MPGKFPRPDTLLELLEQSAKCNVPVLEYKRLHLPVLDPLPTLPVPFYL